MDRFKAATIATLITLFSDYAAVALDAGESSKPYDAVIMDYCQKYGPGPSERRQVTMQYPPNIVPKHPYHFRPTLYCTWEENAKVLIEGLYKEVHEGCGFRLGNGPGAGGPAYYGQCR